MLAAGKDADIVLIDAPDGGTQDTALAAIRNGDIAAVGAVITDGVPRFVGRSRNTPATTRKIRVASASCRGISRACPLGGRAAAARNRDCSIMQHDMRKPPAMRSNCALQRCICALHA